MALKRGPLGVFAPGSEVVLVNLGAFLLPPTYHTRLSYQASSIIIDILTIWLTTVRTIFYPAIYLTAHSPYKHIDLACRTSRDVQRACRAHLD